MRLGDLPRTYTDRCDDIASAEDEIARLSNALEKAMTTKYLLFAGSRYYPSGGASDCKGVYDTKEDAIESVAKGLGWGCDWAHIARVDGNKLLVVWDTEGEDAK